MAKRTHDQAQASDSAEAEEVLDAIIFNNDEAMDVDEVMFPAPVPPLETLDVAAVRSPPAKRTRKHVFYPELKSEACVAHLRQVVYCAMARKTAEHLLPKLFHDLGVILEYYAPRGGEELQTFFQSLAMLALVYCPPVQQ